MKSLAPIVARAATAYGVTPAELFAGRRHHSASAARAAVAWAAIEAGLPQKVAAHPLGVTTTAVWHGHRRGQKRRQSSELFSSLTDELLSLIVSGSTGPP